MKTVVAFAGPSVPIEARAAWPNIKWLPPAQAGDFLRLLGKGVHSIALIDGYFDHCPAVWHKEILLAMSEGIAVVGASSMGALRAAELDQLGMAGIGTIYQAYRARLLTGDDEVALVHAPEKFGWKPLSVPMVEVRATLALALRRNRIDRDEARRLRDIAHEIYFVDRDWPSLSRAWLAQGVEARLTSWIVENHVQLKRDDAVMCLDRVASHSLKLEKSGPVPRTVFLNKLQLATADNADSISAKNSSPTSSLNRW